MWFRLYRGTFGGVNGIYVHSAWLPPPAREFPNKPMNYVHYSKNGSNLKLNIHWLTPQGRRKMSRRLRILRQFWKRHEPEQFHRFARLGRKNDKSQSFSHLNNVRITLSIHLFPSFVRNPWLTTNRRRVWGVTPLSPGIGSQGLKKSLE